MTEEALFDDPEVELAVATIRKVTDDDERVHVPSTAATKARYAFLKTKRLGATWEESGALYRMGPTGVTVFDADRWGDV